MREYKFRAWDKERKRFVKFDPHCFTMGHGEHTTPVYSVGENNTVIKINNEWFYKNDYKVVWLQFTGLLDKNGKEIYDGDILHYHGDSRLKDSVVYWDENLLSWEVGTEGVGLFKQDGKYWEVIGNIYENPELLQ